MKCGVVQFCHAPGNKSANLAIVERYAAEAHEAGIDLLAFPEMCITGYWHARNLDRNGWVELSESVPGGPTCGAIIALAGRLQMAIGVGLVELGDDGRLFNTYIVAMPDGNLHRHRKLHAFESRHISSGDDFTVFDTPWGVKLGILICWDNNLVENVRATALLGADILLAPHQTGGTNSRSPYGMKPIDPALWPNRGDAPERLRAEFQGDKGRGWLMRWLPSRAHDNGMFILFANGVGEDDRQDERREPWDLAQTMPSSSAIAKPIGTDENDRTRFSHTASRISGCDVMLRSKACGPIRSCAGPTLRIPAGRRPPLLHADWEEFHVCYVTSAILTDQ